MDLLVVADTVGKAGPARTLLRRTEDRAEKRLYSYGPDQYPWRARFQALPVDCGKSVIKIVGSCVNGQGRTVCAGCNAQGLKPFRETAVVTMNGYPRCLQAFLSPTRRYALRGPEGRLAPFHAMLA